MTRAWAFETEDGRACTSRSGDCQVGTRRIGRVHPLHCIAQNHSPDAGMTLFYISIRVLHPHADAIPPPPTRLFQSRHLQKLSCNTVVAIIHNWTSQGTSSKLTTLLQGFTVQCSTARRISLIDKYCRTIYAPRAELPRLGLIL